MISRYKRDVGTRDNVIVSEKHDCFSAHINAQEINRCLEMFLLLLFDVFDRETVLLSVQLRQLMSKKKWGEKRKRMCFEDCRVLVR